MSATNTAVDTPRSPVYLASGTLTATGSPRHKTTLRHWALPELGEYWTSNTNVLQGVDWNDQSYVYYIYDKGETGAFDVPALLSKQLADLAQCYWRPYFTHFNKIFESMRGTLLERNVTAVSQTDPIKSIDESERHLRQDTEAIFRAAAYEIFEYGMESEFITKLESIIKRHGVKAVAAIAGIILEGQARPQVAAEALRWLGGVDHQGSRLLRLRLLETSLRDSSRWVRDGAAQGLDDLNDPHAIPYLKAAIARERISELRKDLEAVLAQLEHSA